MKYFIFTFACCLITISFLSCAVDKAEELPEPFMPTTDGPVIIDDSSSTDDSTVVSFCDTIIFNKHVRPIFTSICAHPSCHVAGGGAPFPLTKYAEIAAKTDLIIPAIEHTPGSRKMPRNPEGGPPQKLPQFQIDAIKCWVAAGKPNN